MADFKKKRFVKGGAKLVIFPDGGELINLDLNMDSLSQLPVNAAGYVRLVLSRKKEKDQFGNSYSIAENDFVPDKTKATGPKKPSVSIDSDSPFI